MSGSKAAASTQSEIDWGTTIRSLVAAWLIPGCGHFYLGRRRRAIAFAAIVLSSLLIGLSLDGNLYRIVPNQPLTILATAACLGIGAPYLGLRFLAGYSGDLLAPGFEYGSAFILSAGLMNLLLILDCWDIAMGKKD
jgi:hypothetical protein